MDEIVVLAPTHWNPCQAIRVVNQTLGALELEKHSAKTYIGWMGKRKEVSEAFERDYLIRLETP
jgi:hypothetical protein